MNLKNSKRTYSPKAPKQSTLENMFPKSNESTMKVLDDKIVDFLADSGVAFRTIGLQSFKDVIASVNNKVEVKSRVFYSKLVEQKADEMRDELIGILEYIISHGVDTVSFTTDLWSSKAGNPFTSLTLYFIHNFQLFWFTPYVKPFPERHTGIDIDLC